MAKLRIPLDFPSTEKCLNGCININIYLNLRHFLFYFYLLKLLIFLQTRKHIMLNRLFFNWHCQLCLNMLIIVFASFLTLKRTSYSLAINAIWITLFIISTSQSDLFPCHQTPSMLKKNKFDVILMVKYISSQERQ